MRFLFSDNSSSLFVVLLVTSVFPRQSGEPMAGRPGPAGQPGSEEERRLGRAASSAGQEKQERGVRKASMSPRAWLFLSCVYLQGLGLFICKHRGDTGH